MSVRDDCRHYSSRSMPSGNVAHRCRLDVNDRDPFACPESCMFFEPRPVSNAGWHRPKSAPNA